MLFKKPEKIENIDASNIGSGLYLKVIDGKIYGASGGGGGGGTEILTADTYALMSSTYPASSHPGEYCYVINRTGWINPFTTTRDAGLYYSNGTTWINDVLPEAVSVQDESGNKYVGTFLKFLNGTIDGANGTLSVSANQVGAYTTSQVDTLISNIPTPDVSGQISTHNTSLTSHMDIRGLVNEKQDILTAGTGISIVNNVVSNTQTSANWGNITGTLSSQTDLKSALDSKENSLPSTPINPETKFLNANKEWSDISIGNGGYSANLYFTTDNSDVSGYNKISYTLPTNETELPATINNQEALLKTYLYDDGIGLTTIDAGNWVANFTAKVSTGDGVTQLRAEVFLRHTDNTETILFSAYSPELNNTDYLVIRTESNQQSFTCAETDRLGIRIYGKTTNISDTVITTIIGDGRASYFTTPLRLKHSQLRDLNTDNNYLHVTSTEKSTWDGKQDSLGFTPENSTNKTTILSADSTDAQYPTAKTVYSNLVTKASQDSLAAEIARASDAEATKVDKVDGKGLSTNDLTDTLKSNYDTAYTNTHTHTNKTILDNTTASFTTAQATLLGNQSGVNTGDETQSSIIIKIGYTPLAPNGSGANLTGLNPLHLSLSNSTVLTCYSTTTQSLSAGQWTKILCPVKGTDNLNEWNTASSKFTPAFSQTLLLYAHFLFYNSSSPTHLWIKKDGADYITFDLADGKVPSALIPQYFAAGHSYEFYMYSSVANTIGIYTGLTMYTLAGA